MFKNFKKIIILILSIFYILNFNINILAQEQNNQNDLIQKKIELEQKIKEKNEELKKINEQLQNTQSNLETVQKQKTTLQNEIKKLTTTVQQLELNIAADTATIEKLKLEIDSLNYDIENINLSINKKKEVIIKSIQEIQKSENKNILNIILANNSLADSFLEIQNLFNLKNQLRIDIKNLSNLQNELNNKLELAQNKKEDVEIRKNNLTIKKEIIKDQQQEKNIILTQTKNQEILYQKQLKELEQLRDSISEEIGRIEEELRKSLNIEILPSPRKGLLLWPVPRSNKISQYYGNTDFAKRNYKNKWHNGIDIAGPIGIEVVAAEDGIVINTGDQDKYCRKAAYGKFIVIKHENGLTTLYGHLSKTNVYINQKVKRGEIIGYLGNSGWATGPHLHFTIFANHTLPKKQNGLPEGAIMSRYCGPMPTGGDLDPMLYL
ncbi:MAG: peptidoglycan DD-metalloendopeptidase family protein [Patescibacteria group bacterium]|nr:peptidoglycan DD-metalloendopeptidase family protein [Patescibacteria group bacterium]